jgi:hypothetical protein
MDGRSSEIRYTSGIARLTMWQRRGGYYIGLPDDGRLTGWCARWEQSWLDKPEMKVIRSRSEILVRPSWWECFSLVPGIGLKMAEALGRWLPDESKTFADGLTYLSWPRNYRRDDHPPGIGPGTFERARLWLGLEEDQALQIYEPPEEVEG